MKKQKDVWSSLFAVFCSVIIATLSISNSIAYSLAYDNLTKVNVNANVFDKNKNIEQIKEIQKEQIKQIINNGENDKATSSKTGSLAVELHTQDGSTSYDEDEQFTLVVDASDSSGLTMLKIYRYNGNMQELASKNCAGASTCSLSHSLQESSAGIYTYYGYAFNKVGSYQYDTLQITIVSTQPQNTAPSFTSIPDQTIDEDYQIPSNWIDLWQFASDAETPDAQLSFALISQTNSSLINCFLTSNRYIDCNLTENAFGTSTVGVSVSDGQFSDQASFTITVNPVNDAPVINPTIPDQHKTEDASPWVVDLTLYENDVEDNSLTLYWTVAGVNSSLLSITINDKGNNNENSHSSSLSPYDSFDRTTKPTTSKNNRQVQPAQSNQPAQLSPSQSSQSNAKSETATFTLVPNACGTDTVTFTLHDSDGATDSQDVLIDIACVNDAPWISPIIPNQNGIEDTQWSYDLASHENDIEDSDSQLTWSVSGYNSSLVTITIGSKPKATKVDKKLYNVIKEVKEKVIVIPYTQSLNKESIKEKLDKSFLASQNEKIKAEEVVQNVPYKNKDANDIVYFTPTTNACGSTVATFTLTDSDGATDSQDVLIDIACVNDIPNVEILAPLNNSTFAPGEAITFIGQAIDVEDGNLNASLTWSSSIEGIFGNGDNVIATLSLGMHIINLTVIDSNGASASDSITIYVIDTEAPQVTNVAVVPTVVNQTDPVNISAVVTDNVAVDSVVAEIKWNGTIDRVAMADPDSDNTYNLVYVNSGWVGQYNITIIANDTFGNVNNTETTFFVVQATTGGGNSTTTILEPADGSTFNYSSTFIAKANISAVNGDLVNCSALISFNSSVISLQAGENQIHRLGDILNESSTETQWNLVASGIGSSSITVTTFCSLGGSSDDTVNVLVVSGEAPVVTLLSPVDGSIFAERNVTLSYSAYDNTASSLNCTLFTNTSGAWQADDTHVIANNTVDSFNLTGLADGSYIWNVQCADNGNSAFAPLNWSFTIGIADTEPPVITFISPTPANGSTISDNFVFINTTITDNVAVDSAILEWQGVNESMSGSGTNFYVNKTALAEGLYVYRVYANDSSNNWNVSETRTVTIAAVEESHDIAIESLTLLKEVNGVNKSVEASTVYLNDSIYVLALVRNAGTSNETNVNISLQNGIGIIDSHLIDLDAGQTTLVSFIWNANPDRWHTITVNAKPVNGETNVVNNELSQDVNVWAVCDVIDCSVFGPRTASSSYTVGQPFLVRAMIQNAWNNESFKDFKVELTTDSGLIITTTAVQYFDLAPSQFVIANWNVTSINTGNYSITAWACNREYGQTKYVLIV